VNQGMKSKRKNTPKAMKFRSTYANSESVLRKNMEGAGGTHRGVKNKGPNFLVVLKKIPPFKREPEGEQEGRPFLIHHNNKKNAKR